MIEDLEEHVISVCDGNDDCDYLPEAKTLNTTSSKVHFKDGAKLYASYPSAKKFSSAHTVGRVIIDKKFGVEELVKVLCDTGALSANYVARDLVDRLRTKLEPSRFYKVKHRVVLADSRTVKDLDEGVRLNLVFTDPKSHTYQYTGEFIVIDMSSNDIILGLPALTGKLYPFMCAVMEQAHENHLEDSAQGNHNLSALQNEDMESREEHRRPWSKANDAIAPEDNETELPVQFKDALTFLGKSREEALKDYYEQIETHVSQEMKQETNIMDLLSSKAEKVFVPDEWTGVRGVDPLTLKWKETLPERMKPRARPINPKLWEASEKEFRRLCGYFYQKSRSPWASCLVVAPKATPPYIRFCGDYVNINKHMQVGNYTIPNVKHELDKIINFPLYMDIDLTNAFHQIPLAEETSERLSIQTPWGQYAPKFMPEGIAPATGILQEVVREIFEDFSDWAIVIFDNMLILANDPQDAYQKFEKVIDRCIERNLKLKMPKSWLGFRKVDFFGYVCRHKSYEVNPEKKEALGKIPMPTNTKQARSLLGKGVFFSSFTPRYSDLVAHLTDLTKSKFNWDKTTWRHDYEAEYRRFIKGLQDSCELFYPDYNLEWTLRTDASELGIGSVLLQKKILADGTEQLQPIAFLSKKFSAQAQKWATIEQEAYGIYYSVKHLAYYLIGKQFTIETDHNNLLWMETSEVPKITRWRIFLQSFNFSIKHISGAKNWLADWLSREHQVAALSGIFLDEDYADAYFLGEDCTEDEFFNFLGNFMNPEDREVSPHAQSSVTPEDALQQVHNARVGHLGGRATWIRLNKQFPGHGIPYKVVEDFIAKCPNCVKTRLAMKEALIPIVRNLKPPSARSAIGIDAVEITPHGADGYTHINVVVNLFTKLVYLEPVKGVTALNLANTVWKYWSYYGHTDLIISDQGPDLTSDLFKQLTEYMGVRHTFSIANRHANGCERIIGEVVRHLRALVYENSKRVERKDVFEDPSWIPSAQYILNSEVSSETGYSPFELTFGSNDLEYLTMNIQTLPERAHARLTALNEQLEGLRAASKTYQQQLASERAGEGVHPDKQNRYQPGDFILFDKGAKVHPKMSHRYMGPFVVKTQYKNDIDCQHLATGQVVRVSVTDVKLFPGDRETAYSMALRDQDQHVIDKILYYRGDRESRSTLIFTVRFQDGDVREVPYSKDLFDSVPYADFCSSKRYLYHLIYPAEGAKKYISDIRRQSITQFKPGDHAYVDLRIYGDVWYDGLQLPDSHLLTYVAPIQFTHWYHRSSRRVLSVKDLLTLRTYRYDNYLVHCFVHPELDTSTMVLVDKDLATRYPQVLESV